MPSVGCRISPTYFFMLGPTYGDICHISSVSDTTDNALAVSLIHLGIRFVEISANFKTEIKIILNITPRSIRYEAQLGISIQETNASIGIPVLIISVQERTKNMPWLGPVPGLSQHRQFFSFRYRTDRMPDYPSFHHLYTRTRTHTRTHTYDVRHEHGQSAWTISTDNQHGHEAQTWTCTMDMERDKHHGCRNADKKFSPASLVFRQFLTLGPASAFRHHGQSSTASHGLVRQRPAMVWGRFTNKTEAVKISCYWSLR